MLINIDHKALEHACQCAGRSVHHFDRMSDDLPLRASIIAHARAIEQHEAFRQEVSDAVTDAVAVINNSEALVACEILERFIIAKPDPLVEVFADLGWSTESPRGFRPDRLRAAIEKRGGKIVWGEE